MIAVDASAIMAVLLGEPEAPRIEELLLNEHCVMAAPTRVELGIVIEARNGPAGNQLLEELLDRSEVEVVPFDAQLAGDALVAWRGTPRRRPQPRRHVFLRPRPPSAVPLALRR